MKLKNQVCSLELSKRLRELGVKQDSYFRWCLWDSPRGAVIWDTQTPALATDLDVKTAFGIWHKGIAAFTVAELGRMLGNETASPHLLAAYGHAFNIPDTRFITLRGLQMAMTDPNIGAAMLVYLLENDLISL